MRFPRWMLVPLTLLAALGVASPASAEPGNGAKVVNQADCVTQEFGTYCYDLKYVTKSTETPSGNVSVIANGRNSYRVTGSGPSDCNSSSSDDFRYHALYKDGELHESSNRFVGEKFYVNCSGRSFECTRKVHGHYANGQFQFLRHEVECTLVP